MDEYQETIKAGRKQIYIKPEHLELFNLGISLSGDKEKTIVCYPKCFKTFY
ncbi:hypothetical protein J2S74_002876 [Evansella vedderi]|uniref:Uncharacterized protein n=1 Tax=Evansella vedderi TaxID=38282 RepID=A0ABT9ZW89_9BACI|nr:hypothetical protein [Evansella vedderi]MDQ0255494.1 hypothetical protein [Evansella vedderi]